MVALVDELEERGFLERRADPSDRRVRTLHLTPAGRKALEEAFQVAVAHEQKVSGGLTAAEREELLAYLRRIGEALDAYPGRGHPALRDG
jgi:DNA-binding MarR family transcriptional regulator